MLFWKILWFVALATSIAYAIYLFAGGMVTSATTDPGPVVIRDAVRRGEHHLAGMITVPSPCDEVTVRTQKIDAKTHELQFTTWREPSVQCENIATPRAFRTTIFAPSFGIHFIATLDGRPLPIAVYPTLLTE